MKKKGFIVTDTTGNLIIAVIGLFVVLAFLYFLYVRTAVRAYDKQACMVSVVANSKVRMPITDTELWNVDCPTRYMRFTKTGYIEETGKAEYEVEFRKGNQKITLSSCKRENGMFDQCAYLEQVNQAISEHIFDCWEQFLAGQVNVFSNYNTERQCVVCAVIEFDEDVQNKFGEVYSSEIVREEETLDEYMRTHGPKGRDITYYEYSQDVLDHVNEEYYDYNFGQSYAVVFSALNGNYLESLKDTAKEVYNYVKSFIIKVPYEGGEASFVNVLHYIEQDQVTQQCDSLAGGSLV